jgi:hypothetical protein
MRRVVLGAIDYAQVVLQDCHRYRLGTGVKLVAGVIEKVPAILPPFPEVNVALDLYVIASPISQRYRPDPVPVSRYVSTPY